MTIVEGGTNGGLIYYCLGSRGSLCHESDQFPGELGTSADILSTVRVSGRGSEDWYIVMKLRDCVHKEKRLYPFFSQSVFSTFLALQSIQILSQER